MCCLFAVFLRLAVVVVVLCGTKVATSAAPPGFVATTRNATTSQAFFTTASNTTTSGNATASTLPLTTSSSAATTVDATTPKVTMNTTSKTTATLNTTMSTAPLATQTSNATPFSTSTSPLPLTTALNTTTTLNVTTSLTSMTTTASTTTTVNVSTSIPIGSSTTSTTTPNTTSATTVRLDVTPHVTSNGTNSTTTQTSSTACSRTTPDTTIALHTARVIRKPWRFDLAHGPSWIVIGWWIVLVASHLFFCTRDCRDYPWLSQREYLFVNKEDASDTTVKQCDVARIVECGHAVRGFAGDGRPGSDHTKFDNHLLCPIAHPPLRSAVKAVVEDLAIKVDLKLPSRSPLSQFRSDTQKLNQLRSSLQIARQLQRCKPADIGRQDVKRGPDSNQQVVTKDLRYRLKRMVLDESKPKHMSDSSRTDPQDTDSRPNVVRESRVGKESNVSGTFTERIERSSSLTDSQETDSRLSVGRVWSLESLAERLNLQRKLLSSTRLKSCASSLGGIENAIHKSDYTVLVHPPLLAMLVSIEIKKHANQNVLDTALRDCLHIGTNSLSRNPVAHFVWFRHDGTCGGMVLHEALQEAANEGETVATPWTLVPTTNSVFVRLTQRPSQLHAFVDDASATRKFVIRVFVDGGWDLLLHLLQDLDVQGKFALARWCREREMSKASDSLCNDDEVSMSFQCRPFGFEARARFANCSRAPPTRILQYSLIGSVVTNVFKDSEAEICGLQPGMSLVRINDKQVQERNSVDICHMLQNVELPVKMSFRTPLRSDVDIWVECPKKRLGIRTSGMRVQHVYASGESLGFRQLDEVIAIDGEPQWDALGNDRMARKRLTQAVARHGWIQFSVHRPWAGIIPRAIKHLCSFEAVFRYPLGAHLPITACGPIYISTDADDLCHMTPFAVWISHGGLVLSLQLCDSPTFCMGLYLHDILSVSDVECENPLCSFEPQLEIALFEQCHESEQGKTESKASATCGVAFDVVTPLYQSEHKVDSFNSPGLRDVAGEHEMRPMSEAFCTWNWIDFSYQSEDRSENEAQRHQSSQRDCSAFRVSCWRIVMSVVRCKNYYAVLETLQEDQGQTQAGTIDTDVMTGDMILKCPSEWAMLILQRRIRNHILQTQGCGRRLVNSGSDG